MLCDAGNRRRPPLHSHPQRTVCLRKVTTDNFPVTKDQPSGVYSFERENLLILSGNQLRIKPKEKHENVRQPYCAVRVCSVRRRVPTSSANTKSRSFPGF